MRILLRAVVALALLLSALPAGAADYQIINGQPAPDGAYPAMAALIDVEFGQFCGGTLIDPDWVLTAAHCFFDARTGGSSVPPDALEVVLDTTDWTLSGERLGVSQIVLHPEYDDFLTVNDIALLRLASPALTPPAPIVSQDGQALYAPGSIATVTGYGITNSGEPSQTLLEVDVPLITDEDCALAYEIVADRHVCAGDPGTSDAPGNDTCQGDSGGPMWTDRGDGVLTVIGITSFGGECGIDTPGVYTEVITYGGWVSGTIDGSIPPDAPVDPTTPSLPEGAAQDPLRIVADPGGVSDPVRQAVAISRQTFIEGQAPYGVIATSTRFPDALSGSSLAYGAGPLLFSGADGLLLAETQAELQRAVRAGEEILVLGGVDAVPAAVDAQIEALGFAVRRLAGTGREVTAAIVADEILDRFGGAVPFDTVIVATGSNWPDAVTVGEIGSWWGIPILLTPSGLTLNDTTAATLAAMSPSTVLVIGGNLAVADTTVGEIEAITGTGSVTRLGGRNRIETAAAVTEYNVGTLYTGGFPPRYIVAVNLRRDADAYAHVLAASMLTGQAGVFAPLEGDGGDIVLPEVLDVICGLDLPILVAGGTDLVSDDAVAAIWGASAGVGCDSVKELQLGSASTAALTDSMPIRAFAFRGEVGETVRIRVDAQPFDERVIDPYVELYGPEGEFVAADDDGDEGPGLNSLLEVVLPATGDYLIEVSSVGLAIGGFQISLDPSPVLSDAGTLTPDHPAEVYTIVAEAGTPVIVEMRALDYVIDPLLLAFDADGNEIGFDDDGGLFPNARMHFITPGGPVDVIATSYADFFGDYTLAIFAPEGGVTFG